MSLLRLKIDILKCIMNKKLEQNNYVINEEIVKISQLLDVFITAYQREQKRLDINGCI